MLKCQIAQHRRCQNFRLGGPNHKSRAMTSSETSKEEFLCGQRYRRMEDQTPWPGIDTQLGTRSSRRLKQIPKVRKCLNWETCLKRDVYCNLSVSQTRVWRRSPQPPDAMGVWGRASSRWAVFCIFFFWKKKAILIPLNHISYEFRAISKYKIFNIRKPIEKIRFFSSPFGCNLSPKHVWNLAFWG